MKVREINAYNGSQKFMDPPPQDGAAAAGQQPNVDAADSKRPIGNRRFSPNLNNRMRPEELAAASATPANTKVVGKDFRKFQRQRNTVKSEEDASNSYGIMPHYVAAERVAKTSANSSAAHASGGAAAGGTGENSGLGGSWGSGFGLGSKSSMGIGGSNLSAKAIKANKAAQRLSSSVASGLFSNVFNDTAPVTLPLCLEPPSVEIYSDPFSVPAPHAPAERSSVSSTFGPENKMFFIQLPRTFPALPSDFSGSPSERPFYNNITQMSTAGSRFHVDPLPVSATAPASSALAIDTKPALPIDARSSASGLLFPPAEESVVIKEEDDVSSDDVNSGQKDLIPSDQGPPPGSCTYTAPAFDILDTREDHVSDKFMNSGQLGTMRFWKSGRVTMMVGGIEFDVSRGAESNFLQQVQPAVARISSINGSVMLTTFRLSTSAFPIRA
jgi:hypothetical protein